MHEVAIAGFILDVALARAEGRRVSRIELQVGRLRQVVTGALTLAFDLPARGTAAEGATLAIETVGVEAKCRACGAQSAQRRFPLRCVACGALDLEVVQGEELAVQWLELEEDAANPVDGWRR